VEFSRGFGKLLGAAGARFVTIDKENQELTVLRALGDEGQVAGQGPVVSE
jgi:hypothetical protein